MKLIPCPADIPESLLERAILSNTLESPIGGYDENFNVIVYDDWRLEKFRRSFAWLNA